MTLSQTLDAFHAAAARADGDAYFAMFAPEAVFLGTDAKERWNLPEFKAYAMPRFASGKGWSYQATARHLYQATGAQVAWFDELLDHEEYGTCRGSGVMRSIDGSWKISQYHLTIPLPNDLVSAVAQYLKKER